MVRRHELSDAEWAVVQPLLPAPAPTGRPRADDRKLLNGILWILGTGAPWRDLPERYGPWQTAYSRLRRWQQSGIWDRILRALQGHADRRAQADRSPFPSGADAIRRIEAAWMQEKQAVR